MECTHRAEIQAMRADMQVMAARIDARVDAMEKALGQCVTKADLREMELRLRLAARAYVFTATCLIIAVMFALEFWPR